MKNYLVILLTLFGLLTGCSKDKETPAKVYNINGFIQKGPFAQGTMVSISELKNDCSETGRTFSTTITDNNGRFDLSNLEISTSLVSLKADGYFYNEINGVLSNSRIVLQAIVDLEAHTAINVNLITTLEFERVKYLVQTGLSFGDAKIQARNEVLNIWGYSTLNNDKPETFNITDAGPNNSILLAISAIMLGTHSEAELTVLISGISTDIKEDGQLDNPLIKSELINEATFLDCPSIKNNLVKQYSDLGENVVVNEFDEYVETFVDQTDYELTKKIEYPAAVNSWLNLLSDSPIIFDGMTTYCIAAKLPKGSYMKVEFHRTPGAPGTGGGVWISENQGWDIDISGSGTTLQASGNGTIVSVPFILGPPTSVDFSIYENKSLLPTFTKKIQWQ